MKVFSTCALILLCTAIFFGQKTATVKKPATAKATVPRPVATPADPAVEKLRFEQAIAASTASERVSALKEFIVDFPNSEFKARSAESLVVARAALGDEKLAANETAEGVALFKLAVEEAPIPIPDRLFAEVVSKFPPNLFFRGQRAAAFEVASMIEKKAEGNTFQLLALASFYISVENGDEAKRPAEAALKIEPSSSAYQTLGLAHRLNFNLEESATAYAKALELDPGSVAAKRSLAEMKRALGKPDEAVTIYSEILAKNGADQPARAGLVLSLFAAGKPSEAENELAKALEKTPGNIQLLAGAAYWYAANGNGAKAVELAEKAIAAEPRFIWSHIALARGLIKQGKPADAERVLVMARKYGNFPTLEYEIAAARLAAGFYRDAVDDLQKSFVLRDGLVQTRLGGRVDRKDKSLSELIAFERKASIFEPASADDSETAAKLKALLEFNNKLSAPSPDETALLAAVDEFVAGDDKMKLHRQLYAADILLQKKIGLAKVLDLTKAALGNTDAALDVAAPAAAVMASELYESRSIAFSRNDIIVVPDVQRPTLSAILRGRIEELAGWTLFQQGSNADALLRLRRAVSVYPEKSAWWRSGMWRLGSVLEAEGKDKEALDSYISSYKADKPNVLKYGAVEALYKKVNGSTDGLEAQIGPNPLASFTAQAPAKETEPSPSPSVTEVKPESVPPAAAEETLTLRPKSNLRLPKALPIQTAEPKTETVKTTDAVGEPAKDAASEKQETEIKEAESNDTSGERPKDTVTETVIPKSDAPVEKPEEEINETANKDVPVEKPAEPTAEPPVANTEVPAETKIVDAKETPPPIKEVPVEKQADPPAERAVVPPVTKEAETKEPAAEPVSSPEPSPAEIKAVENKPAPETSEEKLGDPPVETKKPSATGKKSPARKSSLKSALETKPSSEPKPLFEPIIISVPKQEPIKLKTITDGTDRARIVEDKEIIVPCTISVSQDNISVLKNGGSLGILLEAEPESAIKKVAGTSSSPADVEVVLEPEIGGMPGRRFFLIRSLSPSAGVYQVTFEAPCGKKEIVVNVR